MNRILSRRLVLRGAGVALTLPWLEALIPSRAIAQASTAPKRYMPIFLPNGASENWRPSAMGVGAAWALSPVLEPFGMLKAKMNVISNLENGSAFNADGGSSVEPSHGRQPGAWLTCTDPGKVRSMLGVMEANGISSDQQLAQHASYKGATPIESLQVGLSTVESACDGQPCSNSRSVSWSAPTTPMYKQVDPLEVFNKLTGVIKPVTNMPMPTGPDPETLKRIARNKSVLDSVLQSATDVQSKLGSSDKLRVEEFLTSVREVEKRVTGVSGGMGGVACMGGTMPTLTGVMPNAPKQNTATYNKGDHADAMNALIVLALQCDATRIISYMLEDERSEFIYDHVQMRTFTATSSTAGNGTCPEYHGGGQHGSQESFGSITWWNSTKVAELCVALDAIKEADGSSILDNTIVMYGGAMHGSNHSCNELPTTLIGGGKIGLKQDQHIALGKRPLRDLHFTLMNEVYGMGLSDFGKLAQALPPKLISEILAG